MIKIYKSKQNQTFLWFQELYIMLIFKKVVSFFPVHRKNYWNYVLDSKDFVIEVYR